MARRFRKARINILHHYTVYKLLTLDRYATYAEKRQAALCGLAVVCNVLTMVLFLFPRTRIFSLWLPVAFLLGALLFLLLDDRERKSHPRASEFTAAEKKRRARCMATVVSAALLVFSVGVAVGLAFPFGGAKYLLAVSLLLPPVLLLLSVLTGRKINVPEDAEENERMLRYPEYAKEIAAKRRKACTGAELLSLALSGVTLVCGILLPLACASLRTPAFPLCMPPALLYLLLPLGRIRYPWCKPADGEESVSPALFPELYALAERASKEAGWSKPYRILLREDATVGLSACKDEPVLGMIAIGLLSEEELYAMLLQLFLQIRTLQKEHSRLRRAVYRQSENNRYFYSPLSDLLYRLPNRLADASYPRYLFACSVDAEQDSLREAKSKGRVEDTASALLRVACYERFAFALSATDSVPFYESEVCHAEDLQEKLLSFANAFSEQREQWERAIVRELSDGAHLAVKTKLELLSHESLSLREYPKNTVYKAVCDRLLSHIAQAHCVDAVSDYPALRDARYLRPKKIADDWERINRPVRAETYEDIADALLLLGRVSEAEALCDRVLEALPEEERDYAHLLKATLLLHRLDGEGLSHLPLIRNADPYDLQELLQVVHGYSRFSGTQTDQVIPSAWNVTPAPEPKICKIGKDDYLSPHGFTPEQLRRILDRILVVGGRQIEAVYLLRRAMQDGVSQDLIVLRFRNATAKERKELASRVRNDLAVRVRLRLGVLDLDTVKKRKLDHIDGAKVYDRSALQSK